MVQEKQNAREKKKKKCKYFRKIFRRLAVGSLFFWAKNLYYIHTTGKISTQQITQLFHSLLMQAWKTLSRCLFMCLYFLGGSICVLLYCESRKHIFNIRLQVCSISSGYQKKKTKRKKSAVTTFVKKKFDTTLFSLYCSFLHRSSWHRSQKSLSFVALWLLLLIVYVAFTAFRRHVYWCNGPDSNFVSAILLHIFFLLLYFYFM